jgi:hypothetical protein
VHTLRAARAPLLSNPALAGLRRVSGKLASDFPRLRGPGTLSACHASAGDTVSLDAKQWQLANLQLDGTTLALDITSLRQGLAACDDPGCKKTHEACHPEWGPLVQRSGLTLTSLLALLLSLLAFKLGGAEKPRTGP